MWNNLTMSERAGVIKMAVKAGLRDMNSIRKFYDDSLKYADGGPKKSFDDWYKTIPVDRNDTTSYNLRRAYELAPIEELEAWRTSSIEDLRNGKNHLRSVYKDPNTGIYNFVKSKNHPTVGLELDWYNSRDAADFRSKYDLDTSGDYYRYVPKPDYNITLPEVTILGSKKYAEGGPLPEYLERPKEYNLRPFTIVSKTPKKEVEGNWEVEKNVLLPEVVVKGRAPYRELEVQDIKDNKYIKEQYEKDALQALKGKSKDEIIAIQKQLADSGAYDLNADNLSEKEIKNIQRKIGAKEDGIWGKESANKWRKYNIDGVVGNKTLDAIGKFNNKQNWGRDVPTENTEWCAEWVYNKVMDATGQNYGVYGDAWKMPKNIVDNGGTEIYNIYDSSFSKVKDVDSLKKKTKEAISKNPFDVKTLQVGDIVGIYMPSSNMHETAMREGSTFNTHIGVVTGFNSKGIPIIEHNIHKKHHKDLATNITGSLEGKPQITTVTRPAYEEMHTPFSTDSVESKYTKKSDVQPFKDFANSVAGSKELISKVFSNIDAEEVERITLAVQGRETGFMKNRSSDQKGISGVKESAKKFYRDSIAKKDPMTVSSNLAKTKLSSFTAQERNLLNIHKPSDLEDPKLAGRAAAYLIAKNYDYFVRLKNKYPNLGITMDDVRYLTELSYNQGMRKLKNIGFKDGVKAQEELSAIRKMADINAKVKDISATNYSHLGLLGKFIYDTFGKGHTPYISAAEKYRQKLIETKEKNK